MRIAARKWTNFQHLFNTFPYLDAPVTTVSSVPSFKLFFRIHSSSSLPLFSPVNPCQKRCSHSLNVPHLVFNPCQQLVSHSPCSQSSVSMRISILMSQSLFFCWCWSKANDIHKHTALAISPSGKVMKARKEHFGKRRQEEKRNNTCNNFLLLLHEYRSLNSDSIISLSCSFYWSSCFAFSNIRASVLDSAWEAKFVNRTPAVSHLLDKGGCRRRCRRSPIASFLVFSVALRRAKAKRVPASLAIHSGSGRLHEIHVFRFCGYIWFSFFSSSLDYLFFSPPSFQKGKLIHAFLSLFTFLSCIFWSSCFSWYWWPLFQRKNLLQQREKKEKYAWIMILSFLTNARMCLPAATRKKQQIPTFCKSCCLSIPKNRCLRDQAVSQWPTLFLTSSTELTFRGHA